jgi:hypothetical protein
MSLDAATIEAMEELYECKVCRVCQEQATRYRRGRYYCQRHFKDDPKGMGSGYPKIRNTIWNVPTGKVHNPRRLEMILSEEFAMPINDN